MPKILKIFFLDEKLIKHTEPGAQWSSEPKLNVLSNRNTPPPNIQGIITVIEYSRIS